MIHHQNDATVVGHIAIGVGIAICLGNVDVSEIKVAPEVEALHLAAYFDRTADPAVIVGPAGHDAVDFCAPDIQSNRRYIIAAEILVGGLVINRDLPQCGENEIVGIRFLACRGCGDIHLIGADEGVFGQLDRQAFAIDLEDAVVIVHRESVTGRGIHHSGRKALAFVTGGVNFAVECSVNAVAKFFNKHARDLGGFGPRSEPLSIQINHRRVIGPLGSKGALGTLHFSIGAQFHAHRDVSIAH